MKTLQNRFLGFYLLLWFTLSLNGRAFAQSGGKDDSGKHVQNTSNAVSKARVFYYDGVPRRARYEVTLSHVQGEYFAQALWAKGQSPESKLKDTITITLTLKNEEVHQVPIHLADVKRIAVTWRDGGWTDFGVNSLEVRMKDGTVHSLTMVPAKPDDHGPHLYRCIGTDGILKSEVKGFFDLPLPNATPIPVMSVNQITGARGVPTSIRWRFTGFTGLEQGSPSDKGQPEKRKFITLRSLESIEFTTE